MDFLDDILNSQNIKASLCGHILFITLHNLNSHSALHFIYEEIEDERC